MADELLNVSMSPRLEMGDHPTLKVHRFCVEPADARKTKDDCCVFCEETIEGPLLRAMEQTWHPEHFRCSECDSVFGSNEFYVLHGKPCCEKDFNKCLRELCAKCGKLIDGKICRSFQKSFHEECFVCSVGPHPLPEGETFACFLRGELYCESHQVSPAPARKAPHRPKPIEEEEEEPPRPRRIKVHQQPQARTDAVQSSFGVTLRDVVAQKNFRESFAAFVGHDFPHCCSTLLLLEELASYHLQHDELALECAPASERPQDSHSALRRRMSIHSTLGTLRVTVMGIIRRFGPEKGLLPVLLRVEELWKKANEVVAEWDELEKKNSIALKEETRFMFCALEVAVGVVVGSDGFQDAAFAHLENCCWEAFTGSEEYLQMMAARVEKEHVQEHPVHTPSMSDGESEVDETILSTPDVSAIRQFGFRSAQSNERGWVNAKGYRSLHVDVMSAQGLRSGRFGTPDAFVVVSVESTSFKTKNVKSKCPVWYKDPTFSHFEFPLSSTTQCVNLNVFAHNSLGFHKHLGHVVVHLDEVASAQADFEAEEAKKEEKEKEKEHEELTLSEIMAELNKAKAEKEAIGRGGVRPPTFHPLRKAIDSKVDASKLKRRGMLGLVTSLHMEEPDLKSCAPAALDAESMSFFLTDFVRSKVSKSKKRFHADGFDLDLSYITDRIMAMGYPSSAIEGMYRNKMGIVKKFFEQRHNNHYKIYNLCSERSYDSAKFDGRACRFPFDDHNPCPFGMIDDFCQDVHAFLSEHPQNVAAIHCKAGKGRTGLLIGCYLLYSRLFPTALSALKYYAARRTYNRKGVTIPSQIRYVFYYERYLRYQRMMSRLSDLEEAPNSVEYHAVSSQAHEALLSKHQPSLVQPSSPAAGGEEANRLELPRKELQKRASRQAAALEQEREEKAAKGFLGIRRLSLPQITQPIKREDPLDYMAKRAFARANYALSRKGTCFLPDKNRHHVYLSDITIHTFPKAVADKKKWSCWFKVINPDTKTSFSSIKEKSITYLRDDERGTIHFNVPRHRFHLFGDVQFVFYHSKIGKLGKVKMFQCWVNTRFAVADDLCVELTKPELDKAVKDTKHRALSPDVKAVLRFSIPSNVKVETMFSVVDRAAKRYTDLGLDINSFDAQHW